ncbi:MAG: hypothetical protein OIF38_08720, partial [Cellvibrionaceae bacterium]|nr:hypothetical protein [Cellvibrionaceae bacterium]
SAKGRGREAVSVKYLPPEEGSSKRITRVSNGLGAVTDYHIEDISGRDMVVRVSGQGCAACASTGVSYRFSDRYQVLEKANDNGSAEIYEYDELGRRTSRYYRNRQGEKSLQLRVSYNGGSHNPSKIEESSIAPGRFFSRNLSYNDKGQLISIKESGYAPKLNAKQLASLDFSQGFDEFQFSPVERTTKLLYNQQGQLSQIDGPLPGTGDIIKLEYDNNHKLISVTGPDGRKMQILAYDSDGRPTKAQYNQQPAIEMNYTDKGDIATVTQNGRQFQYQYSITGKLKQVISPDGNSLKLHYDDSDTATGFTGPDGRRFHSDLDAEGRRINSQIFDRQGQLLEKIAYAYDAYGRLAGVDKGNEQAHTIQYGKAGEVLTQS